MIAFLQIIVMFVLHGLRDGHGTTMTVEGYIPEVAVHMMGLFQFFFFFCEEVRLCVYHYHTGTVSSGDDHHTTMIFSSCSLDGFDG